MWRWPCCGVTFAGCVDIWRRVEKGLQSGQPRVALERVCVLGRPTTSAEDQKLKRQFVRDALTAAQPKHVLDLGANSGVYSRIAAECGAKRHGLGLRICRRLRRTGARRSGGTWTVAPLIANPARPTPAAGWRNAENLALLDRSRARFDLC